MLQFARQQKLQEQKSADDAALAWLSQLNADAITALIKRSTIVYSLMLKYRPLSDFGDQLSLQTELDTPGMTMPDVIASAQYTSHRFAEDMADAIDLFLWLRALADLKSSTWIGLMTDESTDNANIKQCILYLCGVKDGEPFCKFATMFAIPDGKAHTITGEILRFLSILSYCFVLSHRVCVSA